MDQSCDRLHSRDDLDRIANRETELAVRAPLIDGDFDEAVGIRVPEGRRDDAECICHAARVASMWQLDGDPRRAWGPTLYEEITAARVHCCRE